MAHIARQFGRTGTRLAAIGGALAVATVAVAIVAAMVVAAIRASDPVPGTRELAGQTGTTPARTLRPSAPVARHGLEGVLTYRLDEKRVAVRVDNPATWVDPAPAEALVSGIVGAGTEVGRSPDGRFTATVARDRDGTRLDVRAGAEVRFSLTLSGPSDPELRGDKALAAAVEGVPLV